MNPIIPRQIRAFLPLLFLTLGYSQSAEKTIYVDTRISGPEDGSAEHPWHGGFDRNTGIYHFDQTLRDPAKCPFGRVRIVLKAGTYWTRGSSHRWRDGVRGWAVREGWTLEGEGIDKTILLLADIPPGRKHTVISTGTADDFVDFSNITVRNLTVDCNYDDLSKVHGPDLTLQAVVLWGTRNLTIDNVRAIQAAGMRINRGRRDETFVLTIGNGNIKNSSVRGENYLISNCRVDQVMGQGQCSAISFLAHGTAEGIIRSNVVSFVDAPGGGTYAYNVHNSAGVIFEHNKSFGAARAFNQDTGNDPEKSPQQRCIRLRRNEFHVPASSSGAFIWDSQESFFEENDIWLEGEGAVGVILVGPAKAFNTRGARRWIIQNNNIYKKESVRTAQGFNFNFRFTDPPTKRSIQALPENIVLRNNYFHTGISNIVPSQTADYVAGNFIFFSTRVPPGLPQPHGTLPSWVESLGCP